MLKKKGSKKGNISVDSSEGVPIEASHQKGRNLTKIPSAHEMKRSTGKRR